MAFVIIDSDSTYVDEIRKNLNQTEFSLLWAKDKNIALSLLQEQHENIFTIIMNICCYNTLLSEESPLLNIPIILISKHGEEKNYQNLSSSLPSAIYSYPIDYTSLSYSLQKNSISYLNNSNFSEPRSLFVKKRRLLTKIEFELIKYFHGEGNYITIFTKNQKFLKKRSLKQLEKSLPTDQFIRTHRNYIVNVDFINELDINKSVIYIDNIQIPIGRTYKQKVRKIISS